MISIVGFGRPKFKGSSGSSDTAKTKTAKKKCESCGQEIK